MPLLLPFHMVTLSQCHIVSCSPPGSPARTPPTSPSPPRCRSTAPPPARPQPGSPALPAHQDRRPGIQHRDIPARPALARQDRVDRLGRLRRRIHQQISFSSACFSPTSAGVIVPLADALGLAPPPRGSAPVTVISHSPPPCTTRACFVSSLCNASAIMSIMSSRATPSTCRRAPAGLVSGPMMLKSVLMPSSRRTGAACRIAGCIFTAYRNPSPTCCQAPLDHLDRRIDVHPQAPPSPPPTRWPACSSGCRAWRRSRPPRLR